MIHEEQWWRGVKREAHTLFIRGGITKNPISLDCNCLITVIISLHEGSFIKEKLMTSSKFTTVDSRVEKKERAGNKNLVKASCWRCVIQHCGEKDDSHFTESGQSVKCYNKLELLFPRRVGLPDFEIFRLNKRCTFDLCASHAED